MKTELQNQLVASHPTIFREVNGIPDQTCMAFGIECGDGWHDLIETLCEQIDASVEWANRLFPDLKFGVVAAQVKEKYGSLRFYVDFIYDINLEPHQMEKIGRFTQEINGMIRMVEALSAKTCETCGGSCSRNTQRLFPHAQCVTCAEVQEANSQNSYFKENHK